MEKTWNVLKTILLLVLIILIITLCFGYLSSIKDVRDWMKNVFNQAPIDVDAFADAPTNWNGGLTKQQIEKEKADKNCPQHDDVTDTIYIQDYDDIVCFYKIIDVDGKTIYPNIVFVKTTDGLKFDGALNMRGIAKYSAQWYDYLNPAYPYSSGPSEYFVEQQYNKEPSYWYDDSILNSGWWKSKTNLCIFDSSDTSFYLINAVWKATDCAIQFYLNRNIQATALSKAQQYIINNIYKYFLTFDNGNIEIIQTQDNKEVSSGQFNYFYDYLYECAKSYDFGKDDSGNSLTSGTCSVDVSKLTVFPLPNELKNKYPVENTNPTEFYNIYNCNFFMTCQYSKVEKNTIYSDSSSIENGIKNDPIEKQDLPIESLSTITFTLTPKGNYLNSEIVSVVSQNNVKIKIFDNTDSYVRTISFAPNTFTNCSSTIRNALKNGKYFYEIESNGLIFDKFSGSFEITGANSITFEYSYQNGQVMGIFSITPISSDVDYSQIDFTNYPVRIILNSEDKSKTYQIVFDSIDKISEKQFVLIYSGKYSYTILSEKLVFASTSGSLEIIPKNRTFDFSFDITYNRSDLAFSVTVSESTSGSNGIINLRGDSDSVKLLGSKLNLQNYFVNVTIFDDNGNIVETFDHTHNGTGGCSDTWTAKNLVANTKYTAQMTYTNSKNTTDPNYIEYQSATFSFTYKLLTSYTLKYSCTEVK